MAKRKTTHVVPNTGANRWAVKVGGNPTPISTHRTKQIAVLTGRLLSKKNKSEFIIHNRDGKISQADSHGKDPFPPKG